VSATAVPGGAVAAAVVSVFASFSFAVPEDSGDDDDDDDGEGSGSGGSISGHGADITNDLLQQSLEGGVGCGSDASENSDDLMADLANDPELNEST
jgi:hypothetical protein